MEKIFFLDAYALIYRAYYAFIRNPRVNSKGFNTSAVFGFINTLEDLLKKENPTHIGVAFDPSGPTFRHEAYELYKAQRQETPEDIRLSVPIIKDIIRAYNIPILEVAGYEADDVIGTLATEAGKKGYQVYMVTPDKDYGQLVTDNVFIYRPKYGDKEYEVLGIREVCEKFQISSPCQIIDMLSLMGDSSDNIPGCPGIGEKTAQKLIAEFDSVENLLENTEQLKGAVKKKIEENKEMIAFSKFLATIKIDVPVSLDMDQLARKPIDEKRIREIFEELEFRTMINRVLGQKAVNSVPQQRDLFSEFTDETTGVEEYSNLNSYNPSVQNYQLVDSQDKIERLLTNILASDFLCFDTETTGLDPNNCELVGLSFSIRPDEAFYVPVPESKEEAQELVKKFLPVFGNEKISKIGQNIKYDILVLMNYGVTVKGDLFDTMIAHYLLQPEMRHGMDYLSEIYLQYKTIPIDDLIGPKGKKQQSMRQVPLDKITIYAAEDADITLKLKYKLEEELKNNNLESLFYDLEMPLMRVLVSMERNGVRVDINALSSSAAILNKDMQRIEQEIFRMTECEFNVSSPKQVGEVLFEKLQIIDKAKKTKSGQYSTSEEVLEGMRNKHDVIPLILEYRGLKKLLNTYIEALPQLINNKTGKIHTSFNQTVTATGRLSSSNPNLQNIPIRDKEGKEIRRAFIPEEGCLFFSADYSQIELRIMAHLSEDPGMIEAFNSGHDIHAATASRIYKVPIDEVTSNMRRKAKTANFGIIYGISVFGLAERLNIERKEAKELIDGYFETYPRIREYMDESIKIAQQNGYVETILHRKRYLADINSKNAVVRGYAERNAINAPIQGSAADIIKIAMIHIWRRFQEEKLRSQMILQVHDELNFSVYPDEKELVEKIVIEEMEKAFLMRVELKVDSGWGNNWLEAH